MDKCHTAIKKKIVLETIKGIQGLEELKITFCLIFHTKTISYIRLNAMIKKKRKDTSLTVCFYVIYNY